MGQYKNTGHGYFRCLEGGTFYAILNVNGLQKTLLGGFDSSVANFDTANATIQYDDISDLKESYYIDSPRNFDMRSRATIGPETFNLPYVNSSGKRFLLTGETDVSVNMCLAVKGQITWMEE